MTQTPWVEARILFTSVSEGGHAADQGKARLNEQGWVDLKQDGGGFTTYPPEQVFRILWLSDPWAAEQ
ncbi:hypothetical protein ABTX81_06930 [Kitasatospora sp. NPDC097605]|uniref:hypothetical protein n=1 Tax=Kitasatospora sp. NPDC097605 TaxID=3157226 RepID=UPI00331B63FC